jgi:hypothetical protein
VSRSDLCSQRFVGPKSRTWRNRSSADRRRYIEPGQPVEATFKFASGKAYQGKVESVLQAVASGQTRVSGSAVAPEAIHSAPVVVRIKLDDAEFAARLPAGSTGTAAIFTDHVKAAHVIRMVLLRQVAITNYVNPF